MGMKVNNPFAAKQGLNIALEIARYELSSAQIDRINNFFALLNNSANQIELEIEDDLLSDIKVCVTIFKKSKSIYWVREDFVKEVLHLNNYCLTYRQLVEENPHVEGTETLDFKTLPVFNTILTIPFLIFSYKQIIQLTNI